MPFCFYVAIVVMNECVYGDNCVCGCVGVFVCVWGCVGVCVCVSVVEGCLRLYFSIILLASFHLKMISGSHSALQFYTEQCLIITIF